jgi:UDP-N-acetylmuramoyl-tripeptide--D-alanyl-D-alanine ligase
MGLLDTVALLISMVPGILFAAAILLSQIHYCHVLQLEGYVNRSFFKWLRSNLLKSFGFPAIIFVIVFLVELLNRTGFWPFLFTYEGTVASIVVLIACAALLFVYASRIRFKQAKKPLVYTARIKRLFLCIIVVFAVLYVVFEVTLGLNAGLLVLLIPLLSPLCNLLLKPAEKAVQRYFFNDAKEKLALRRDIIKVGITGSYGKTSTKFILGTILSQKYKTLVPPSSFNTPMGLTRVIREQMTDEHEVFIAEMGARHVGDIAELCDLVHPQYAILTSVGPQHLETFFSIENVMKGKFELIEGLPADGIAVFNGENEYVRQLYAKTKNKKIMYALKPGEEVEIWVENIKASPEGSEFEVVYRDGSRFVCKTKLLGRHNILNILGGIAMAAVLNLSRDEIVRGVSLVEPVEHRLQILPTGNGVTVIDDAFNSNPEGSASAVEVISQFPGRKIVVTPGMVELGEKEEAENYKFGKIMSSVCDYVFLIGPKHTKPIYNGLADGGFPIQNIFVARTLDEASAMMGGMLQAGDVVLFENDLPDNYNE